jgi:hypothetical protein
MVIVRIMKHITIIIVAVILAFGIIGAGTFIRDGLIEIQSADRYVTVKGLAERDVKADMAVWSLQFKVAGDNLQAAQDELNRQSEVILTFLANNNISKNEITVNRITVNDAMTQQYRQNDIVQRYAIDKIIMVRTNNVDSIVQASQKISELIQQGVVIGYGAQPQYSYTKLNTVKPEMIAIATRNARAAAQQFAADSGSQVGTIRSASQGYFSINARDNVGQGPASASLYKRIRIVSTIEYYIHD